MTAREAKNYWLSKNFNLYEFLHSDTAIANGITDKQLEIDCKHILNLTRLCANILQPLRTILNKPIHINSGYRSNELNKLVNGSKNSDHMEGKAADIDTFDLDMTLIHLRKTEYKQLIRYGNPIRFIHISYDEFDKRKQELYYE